MAGEGACGREMGAGKDADADAVAVAVDCGGVRGARACMRGGCWRCLRRLSRERRDGTVAGAAHADTNTDTDMHTDANTGSGSVVSPDARTPADISARNTASHCSGRNPCCRCPRPPRAACYLTSGRDGGAGVDVADPNQGEGVSCIGPSLGGRRRSVRASDGK